MAKHGKCRFEAALGADPGVFVDEDGGGIHADGAMYGGFQDEGAAGDPLAAEINSEFPRHPAFRATRA